eukprot:COSAG02_NODE_40501_length_404_cov_11.085246_1_plen_95_part_00
MHYQSEFQCDPFQDRPAEKGGQEWVEFMVCAFVCLEETGTTAPARCLGAVVPNSSAGGGGQPSYTVRTVGPDQARIPGYSLGVLQYKLVLTHIQ